MSRGAHAVSALLLWVAPLAAQHGNIGPEVGVSDYREITSGLRYSGIGPGVSGCFVFRRLRVDGVALWLHMTPHAGAQATQDFQVVQLDGWAGWQALSYLTLEAGFTRRSPDAASTTEVGAVRLGARTHYELGRGATVALRGDYLAGARFSGGGSAPLALELGLGLELVLSRHLRAALDYSFQRFDRTTHPGGGTETKTPIQQALGRLGLAVGL